MSRVYLDHNATTPLRPEARELLLATMDRLGGNPSSVHASGRAARGVLDEARARVAAALGVDEGAVTFTSGGTEANNLALVGVLRGREPGSALVALASEHASVLEPARQLEREGYRVSLAPVDRQGLADPQTVADLARDAALLSVAAANNETGALGPLEDLRATLGDSATLVHTDAAQALGRIPLHLERWGVDFATLSAHKVGGPPGVGILVRCTPAALAAPLVVPLAGGDQEHGLRPGTENTPAIAAAALAIELAVSEQEEIADRWRRQTAVFWEEVQAALPLAQLLGPPLDSHRRLPNTLSILMPEADGRVIVTRLDLAGLEVSAGSACASGSLEPSHVLVAMGLDAESARAGLRFSLGRTTSDDELCRAVEILSKTFAAERKSS